ncbi:hypothetical protein [Pseudomonas sp. LB3P31]
MSRLPIIGVTGCSTQTDQLAASDILDGLDGSIFTASTSNIEPFHYSGLHTVSGTSGDSARVAHIPVAARFLQGEHSCARQLQGQSVSHGADASNNA